jgi:hypothetical protein
MQTALFANGMKPRWSGRRGVLTAWTIWLMLAAGAIVGGLFNVLWISFVRNQAQNCVASAAISAGHHYLSDDMLRGWQQPFEYEGRLARSREAAIQMVERARAGTTLPPISEEHVEVLWGDHQTASKDPALLVPQKIIVSFDRRDAPHSIASFFSGLAGNRASGLGVSAAVCLEHAPAAFQPSASATVPMLPFSICDDVLPVTEGQTPATAGYWSANIESGSGRDIFSWDPDTHTFQDGPDGLPELKVSIYAAASGRGPDAFIPLSFRQVSSPAAGPEISGWIKRGLGLEDLKTFGIERIAFPGTLPTASLSIQDQALCSSALQAKIGEPCIVCLSSIEGAENGAGTLKLKRPVAVRIVQVRQSASTLVDLILQPCVMVTSTAVTSTASSSALNRYLYSVRLTN